MQKSVKCQAGFLLVHKKLPSQLLIGPKKYCNVILKIKTAKSKHQIIYPANSPANSIKSIHQKQLQCLIFLYCAVLTVTVQDLMKISSEMSSKKLFSEHVRHVVAVYNMSCRSLSFSSYYALNLSLSY